jgi:hypothetical protein
MDEITESDERQMVPPSAGEPEIFQPCAKMHSAVSPRKARIERGVVGETAIDRTRLRRHSLQQEIGV